MWELNVRLTFGRALLMKGDFGRAEKFLGWSVEATRRYGYRRFEALAYEFMGELRYYMGRYREALRYLLHTKEVAFSLAPRGDIAVEVLRRLGEVYIALGKLKKAEKALNMALEVSESLEDRYERGAILRAFAVLHSKLGKRDISTAYLRESILTLTLIKDRLELARTYETSARELMAWAKDEREKRDKRKALASEARSHCLEAVHLYSSLGITESTERAKELLKKIDGYARSIATSDGKLVVLTFNENWLFGSNIVAMSPSMRDVIAKAEAIATSAVPVLITGETGTGKELIARYIHELSGRKGDFVAVNCASIPETMFETEFFGHIKGAFTDARSDRAGFVEIASGGTLFLDEFTELKPSQQAKLLRVLQEKKVRRVGDTRERNVDIRVISACNTDVDCLVKSGRLRKDFYYRICAERIKIEPLRFRKKDIEALVAYTIKKLGGGMKIEENALELMKRYHWPGNVRELLVVLQVLIEITSRDGIIRAHDLPAAIRDARSTELSELDGGNRIKAKKLYGQNADLLRRLIHETLEKHNWNRSAAARELGISRMTLYRWLKKVSVF